MLKKYWLENINPRLGNAEEMEYPDLGEQESLEQYLKHLREKGYSFQEMEGQAIARNPETFALYYLRCNYMDLY